MLYLDTSALLKLYVEEEHSAEVDRWVAAAEVVATSRVTLPEAVAALWRKHRDGDISRAQRSRALADIVSDWPALATVDLDERHAADLAMRRGLRGFDSIQLSAALTAKTAADPMDLAFASFDSSLNRAARAEKLIVLEPTG